MNSVILIQTHNLLSKGKIILTEMLGKTDVTANHLKQTLSIMS